MTKPPEPPVTDLVAAALDGDREAWDHLVERFTALVIATARRYRLPDPDIADVTQTVWLQLVQHLHELREPEALPGWLVSTTRHQCVRVLTLKSRHPTFDPQGSPLTDRVTTPDIAADVADHLEHLDRHQAVLAGFAELPASDRQLLTLLAADPPLSYAQISQQMNIPIGSIGPTRGRALKRLRATVSVSQLVDSDT